MLHERCNCMECISNATLDIVDVMKRFDNPAIAMGVLFSALGYAGSIMSNGDMDTMMAWAKRATKPSTLKLALQDGHNLRLEYEAAIDALESRLSTQH